MATMSTRLIGRDMSVWSIDNTSLLALYAGASLDIRVERVDVTAVQDNGRTSRPSHYDWRVTANTLIDGTMTLFGKAFDNDLQDLAMLLTQATTETQFSGNVGHTGFGLRFDEAAQTEGAEYVGIGDLSYGGVALAIFDYT